MSANTNFNTLAAFEAIQSAGLSENQAKRIVQTIVDSQVDLATKQDLADVKTDLKQDIANINWQIKGIIAMQAMTLTGVGVLLANLMKSS